MEIIEQGARVSVKIGVIFLICCFAAQAASDRDLSEWAIRWQGRVILDGHPEPIADVAQLPEGEIRIEAIDLTGAVMHPSELVKLGGLLSLHELYLPGPIWNPGGANEDAAEAFKALATLKGVRKLHFAWHY